MSGSRIKTVMAIIIALVVAAAPVLQAVDRAVKAMAEEQSSCHCAGCLVDSSSSDQSMDQDVSCPCHVQDRDSLPHQPFQAEVQRSAQTDQPTLDDGSENPAHRLGAISSRRPARVSPAFIDKSYPLYLTCCSFLI